MCAADVLQRCNIKYILYNIHVHDLSMFFLFPSADRNNLSGENRVLIVDGGASKRVAILGDQITQLAVNNQWAGIIVNGCIRDSAIIQTMDIGVKALGTHPVKSLKTYPGEKGVTVNFGGVEFVPGNWVYADEVSKILCSASEFLLFSMKFHLKMFFIFISLIN